MTSPKYLGPSKRTMKRLAFLNKEIHSQREWIASCDANGVSYTDPEHGRGAAIREADANALTQLLSEYEILSGSQHNG